MHPPRISAFFTLSIALLLAGYGLSACRLTDAPRIDPANVSRPAWDGLTNVWLPSETPAVLLSRRTVTDTPRSPKPVAGRPTLNPTPIAGLPTYAPTPTIQLTAPEASSSRDPKLEICSPLENVALKDLPRVVSDPYDPPPMGSDARHQGVDFAYYQWKGDHPIADTPVRAILGGIVAAAEANSFPFGNVVIVETPASLLPLDVRQVFQIETGESLYTLYGHMNLDSPTVKPGQAVQPCDLLGYVGKTGNAGASHLHLEDRVGPAGSRFDGFSYYREGDTPEARKNYRLWAVSGVYIHFDPIRLLLFETTHGALPTPTPNWKP